MAESINIVPPTYNFTVEAYHKLVDVGILKAEDKVELIEGKINTMSPINSPHSATVRRLGDILRHIFREKAIISEQNPITLGTHSEPEPDVAVVKFQEDYYQNAHPTAEDMLIAIEVSQSTEKYDRTTKLPLYAKFKIPEYWLVNLNKKEIEIYQNPKNGKYTSITIFDIEEKLKTGLVDSISVKRIIK